MWLPQIETTCRIKSRGSLSVSMLVATVISDILFTLYLVVLANQHWSVWLPQVPDAIQQIILLTLLWHFGDLSSDKPNPIPTPMLASSLLVEHTVKPLDKTAGATNKLENGELLPLVRPKPRTYLG